jgi:PAN domain
MIFVIIGIIVFIIIGVIIFFVTRKSGEISTEPSDLDIDSEADEEIYEEIDKEIDKEINEEVESEIQHTGTPQVAVDQVAVDQAAVDQAAADKAAADKAAADKAAADQAAADQAAADQAAADQAAADQAAAQPLKKMSNIKVGRMYGPELEFKQVSNRNECVEGCKNNDLCFGWSYNKDNKECILMGDAALRDLYDQNEMLDEGNPWITSYASRMSPMKIGTMSGAIINSTTASDPQQCIDMCNNNELCYGISYNKRGQNCELMGESALDELYRSPEGLVDHEWDQWVSSYIEDKGIKPGRMDGQNLEERQVHDQNECNIICNDHPECYAWSYNNNTKQCNLKNKHALNEFNNQGGILHDKDSWATKYAKGSGAKPGHIGENTYINNINTVTVPRHEECKIYCNDDPMCYGWSYIKRDSTCLLKDKNTIREFKDQGRILHEAESTLPGGHGDPDKPLWVSGYYE